MKDRFLTGVVLIVVALMLAFAVSSCEKDDQDPLPYISIQH